MHCTPDFEIDCHATLDFKDLFNSGLLMGVQNQISFKEMHPCFQISNATSVNIKVEH